MRSALFAAMGAAVAISGCAIHPLPEDYSRANTVVIVERIRCEARQAIIDLALTPDDLDKAAGGADANAARASRLLKPDLRAAAIGYTFQFDIFESDGAKGNASFAFPFSNGSFSLAVGGGETKKRQAKRDFDLAERFDDLLADTSLICEPGKANWKYPITGEIGIKEVIETFVRLGGHPLKPGKPTGATRDVYQFTDKLTFATTYNGSVTPTLTLSPVRHDFRLTQASATFEAMRSDIHAVTLAISAPPVDKATGQRLTRSRGFFAEPEDLTDPKASVLRTLRQRRDIDLLREDE